MLDLAGEWLLLLDIIVTSKFEKLDPSMRRP